MASFLLRARCKRALKNYFGIGEFRPGQEKAVTTLLSGRDLLCIFPTGAGKSLCFQLPAVMAPRPTIVVSPLIALMRDQVRQLQARSIGAVSLDSQQSPDEFAAGLALVQSGRARLIYVSPERLQTERFLQACSAYPPWLVVVDEAHCIVQWGSDFRPAYAQINDFLDRLPVRPVVCAMTATADRRMQRGIADSLKMRLPRRVVLPLIRDNLDFEVVTTIHKEATILRCLTPGNKAIIFCRTRAETEYVAGRLRQTGIHAAHYHAGMDRGERRAVEAAFAAGQVMTLASTSAFGMGVDIPDIRMVIHRTLPDQMIDMIQQSGRAGRDGQPARVILLFDPLDLERKRVSLMQRRVQAKGDRQKMADLRADIRDQQLLVDWCLNGHCLTAGMAAVFGQRTQPCGHCSACRRKEKFGCRKRLAPSLRIDERSEAILMWLLRWERDSIHREHRLPLHDCSDDVLRRAVTSGTVRCGRTWQGWPQEKLQTLMDHMTDTRHT